MPALQRQQISSELSVKARPSRAGFPGAIRTAGFRRNAQFDAYLHSTETELLRKALYAPKVAVIKAQEKNRKPAAAKTIGQRARLLLKNRLSGEIAYLRQHQQAVTAACLTLCVGGGLAVGCMLGIISLHFFDGPSPAMVAHLDPPAIVSVGTPAATVAAPTRATETALIQQVTTTDMECLPKDKALCRAALMAAKNALSPIAPHHFHAYRAGIYPVSDNGIDKD